MFKKNVLLSRHSSYKIGGPAKYFFEADSYKSLIDAFRQLKTDALPYLILGGGTNILFSDNGFNGVIIRPALKDVKVSGDIITAGAGVLMKNLLDFTIDRGLSGLEWAGGLPGTLGGAIFGNAGAFGGEIKDVLKTITSVDLNGARPILTSKTAADCDFGYRSSIFKKNNGREIIISATLKLKKGDKSAIKNKIQEKINYRTERHPLEYPNIGSIFKNVDQRLIPRSQRLLIKNVIKKDPFPVAPAAYLIAESGLRGVSFGGAMISQKHSNFIVNVLNAKSDDVKNLIQLTKEKVGQKFGVELQEEILIFKD